MAEPVCARLGDAIEAEARAHGIDVVRGGTYLVMEGPQFSSFAESQLYRAWGADVIGMTNMPEAKLAREAEICYASVGMVTDFDCWHPDHDAVTVDAVIKTLLDNAAKASGLVARLSPALAPGHSHDGHPCPEGCHVALEFALITAPEARDPAMIERLDAIAGRVLKR
jgi:5'-methylthioadenosine phosphorylase